MFKRTIAILAITAFVMSRVEAASLTNVQGAVAISSGNGFVRVTESAALAPGSIVRTSDGTANIVYENGCVVRVGPRQQVSVLDAPPACQTGSFAFPSLFDEFSTGDILTDLAVVLGLVAIIVAASWNTNKGGSGSSSTGSSR